MLNRISLELHTLKDVKLGSNPTNGRDRAMKAPYANKWQKEIDSLRKIALGCDLTEEYVRENSEYTT